MRQYKNIQGIAKMNKFLALASLSLAAFAATGANAATLSLAGLDVEPSLGLTVVSFDNTDPSAISSLTFDFTYVATAPSWSEELVLQVTHIPTGTTLRAGSLFPSDPPLGFLDHCEALLGGLCDVDLGAPATTSDPFTVTGLTFAFDVANGAGLWEVLIGDGFDDTGAFPDGQFEDGSRITINQTPIPVPAAAWLFASALLGLTGLRRRRD